MSGLNLQSVLNVLKSETQIAIQWFENNLMEANPEKFQCMLLSVKENISEVDIGCVKVSCEDYVKLLGVFIDKKTQLSSPCPKFMYGSRKAAKCFI